MPRRSSYFYDAPYDARYSPYERTEKGILKTKSAPIPIMR
jgi:hypothetical protein